MMALTLNHLFAVMTYTENSQRRLAIIEGDTAKIAWEVSLGNVDRIRSTPVIVDVDGDSKQEIAIVYDSDSSLEVDLWAPQITCDESGWTVSGHSNEKLWSYSYLWENFSNECDYTRIWNQKYGIRTCQKTYN